MKGPAGRIFAYVVLVIIGIIGIAPFLYLAILSTKKRIEITRAGAADAQFQLGADRQELQ